MINLRLFLIGFMKSYDIGNNIKIPNYKYNFSISEEENNMFMKKYYKTIMFGVVFYFITLFILLFLTIVFEYYNNKIGLWICIFLFLIMNFTNIGLYYFKDKIIIQD